MIGILLYVFFVVPVASKGYLKNTDIPVFSKVANLLITFVLFVFFFYEFKSIIIELFSLNFYPTKLQNAMLIFNETYIYYSYYLYLFAIIIVYVQAINLAQGKEKGLRLFSEYIFLVVPIICNFFVLGYYNLFGFEHNDKAVVLTLIIVVILIFAIFYLFYRSKYATAIFKSGNLKVVEINENNEEQHNEN